jgi:lysophospholipase L1-like esterase
VVLGASFTVGAGVAYDAIYTSVLEKRLRQSHPHVTVINLAVGGYNIIQSALVLREVGLGLAPDLILIGISPDADFRLGTYETNFRVAAGQAVSVPSEPLYKNLYAYRAYGAKLYTRLKRVFRDKPPADQSSQEWEENAAALKAVVLMARERNVPVRAVLLAETWNFEQQLSSFARVEHQCAALEIVCLNILKPFIARGVDEASLRLNALDAHPNARYHALVAEELAASLKPVVKPRVVRTSG